MTRLKFNPIIAFSSPAAAKNMSNVAKDNLEKRLKAEFDSVDKDAMLETNETETNKQTNKQTNRNKRTETNTKCICFVSVCVYVYMCVSIC